MKQLSRWLALVATGALLLTLFVVAPASPAGAQTDYTNRSVPTTVTINEVAFQDATHGVAVGNGGVVYTTVDAGKTWTARTSGTNASLFAAEYWPAGGTDSCGAAGCIWVAGANGTILFSNDGGVTFCAQTSGTTATLYGLTAAGPDYVAAVGSGGTLIASVVTSASGVTATGDKCGAAAKYTAVATGTTQDLYDVDQNDFGQLYISGANGTLLQATPPSSGGPDDIPPPFTVVPLTSGTTANLNGVASTTSDAGETRVIAVGDGGTAVAGTVAVDGTVKFTAQKSGTTQTLRDVELITDTDGYAVGDIGTVLNTADGGVTWTAAKSGTCANLYGAEFPFGADTTRFASGDRGTVIINIADANGTQPNCATTPLGSNGYRMVAGDGGIFTFGQRGFYGSTGDKVLNKPIVGGATDTSDYEGYWIVASDGGVFTFDSEFHGSAVGQIGDSPAVEIEPTPTGKGYWIVTAKGKVLPFGDAKFQGDATTLNLNQPIIGMSVTATGQGYWLVGQDGGIFSFGDAQFFGSTGSMKLNAPVIDLAPTPDNQGYYLVAKDGGVFTFGSAVFKGSTGSMTLNAPVIAMLVSPNGAGYWLSATDGGVFTFGAVDFLGSMGGTKLNSPVLDLIN